MDHANKERMTGEGEKMKAESIAISKYWEEELRAMPYLSRKCLQSLKCLIIFTLLKRKTARPFIC